MHMGHPGRDHKPERPASAPNQRVARHLRIDRQTVGKFSRTRPAKNQNDTSPFLCSMEARLAADGATATWGAAGAAFFRNQRKYKLNFEDAGLDLTISGAIRSLPFRKGQNTSRIRLSPSSKLQTAEDADHSIATDYAWESELQTNIGYRLWPLP